MTRFINYLFIVQIILGLSAASTYCQTSNKTGNPRVVINLGNTPWKFFKESKFQRDNLAQNKKAVTSGNAKSKQYTVDLGKAYSLDLYAINIAATDVEMVYFYIEGSNDQQKWSEMVKKLNGVKPRLNKVADVGNTHNTVGLVEKTVDCKIEDEMFGHYRYVRLSITKIINTQKDSIDLPKIGFELYGSDEKTSINNYEKQTFDDSKWTDVSVPHCFNDTDTYLNSNKMQMNTGTVWYRKHLTLDNSLKGKKIFLEFEGVNIGAAVYVNGIFKSGNTQVKQPEDVTHVGGFLPFALDITNDVNFSQENIISVRVSNGRNGFYTSPGFGIYNGFGMGWGGIVCPVRLYITDQVHIPLDSYSPQKKWGTYFATMEADSSQAKVQMLTNVENEDVSPKKVKLVTEWIDDKGKTALSLTSVQVISPKTSYVFDQGGIIRNPKLWFPNNSPYGLPHLYTIVSKVVVDDKLTDMKVSKCGLRVITWDKDYCYINSKKHFLNGFGHRNSYPALGSAVPEEIQWNDMRLIAEAGGNALRVGHVPAPFPTVEACDAYGILIMQNSGDNEWSLKGEPASTYKREYDRDMVIAFRNHPSIAVWESNNGIRPSNDVYWPINTYNIVKQWDGLTPRIVSTRDSYPQQWPDSLLIMVGYTNKFIKVPRSPSLNTEVYGARWGGQISWNIARFDFENEKEFTDYFVNDYISNVNKQACGWIDWMLEETQGEGYTIYLNGKANQKSLGSCATDGNRFPKLKYLVYKNALWIPYEKRPGVILQSSWNFAGVQEVSAWSNCAKVELFLNGVSKGIVVPDAQTKKCTWKDIRWEAGTLRAVGISVNNKQVCTDERITAGPPHHIELSVKPGLVKPNGEKFTQKANGSDAALITARVVDKEGNLCVQSNNNLTFSVTGEGVYRGSYNFYVDESKPAGYHAPGDHELQAEGGLMKVAVRSTFKPGKVTVTATANGLQSSTATYSTVPVY